MSAPITKSSTHVDMTAALERQPDVEAVVVVEEPLEIAYDVALPVWHAPEPAFKESDSTDDDEDDEDDEDEAANPDWFNQCCVADHVSDFKAKQKSFGGGYAAVVLRQSLLWEPGQEISYVFLGGTPNQQETVRKVMNEWMRYANILFKKLPVEQAANSHVRIAFNPKDGNWSRLGLTSLDFVTTKATANFCSINEEVEATKEQMGVVLHEIGHILGLKHEHQSPSLKGLLTWIESEVKAYFKKKCKWTRLQTTAEVLTLEDSKDLSSYTHLDVKSIMMYPMPKSTNVFGLGKKGIALPENTALSTYDKAFIGIHYPYLKGNPRSPSWTFERALKEVGCGEYEMERLMELFNEGDWKTIRHRFEFFYSGVRVSKNLEVQSQLFD